MGRDEIGRLIEGLEAAFEVGLAHEDEFVAEDLAHALRQGRDLVDVLCTGPWRVSIDGQTVDVDTVATDHVVCCSGGLLIPLGRGLFSPGRGSAPVHSSSTLRHTLNRLTRRGVVIQADTETRRVVGRVAAVGTDYLELETPTGRLVVPLEGVRSLRPSRGGSEDAS